MAILAVYDVIKDDVLVGVVSDSEYTIRCCGSYGARLADEGWRSEIPNKELVRQLYESYRVQFIHVRAHTILSDEHSIGNVDWRIWL
jgi:ribonuclease HI